MGDSGTTRCTKCGQAKAPTEFYFSKGKQNPWCKACFRDWHRSRYAPKTGADDAPRGCAFCGQGYQPKSRRPSLYCSDACGERGRKTSGRTRELHLLRKYGLTLADYDRMLSEQGGGCALCGIRPEELTTGKYRTYLHVDHDEATGVVRGLLCPDHNLLLGRWQHDPALLRRAAEYLEARASS